ncbi:hypothetical protein PRNP1_008440 [Phytophthora ramorum]
MDGSALDSVSAEASGGVPLVSPPAVDVVDPSAAPGSAGPVTTGLVQPSQRAFRSTPNSTPKGSPARLTEASMAQYGQQEVKQTPDRPATPETASSGSSQRSGSDASEGEKGGDRTQNNCPGDANMLQDGRSDGSRVQQMQVAGRMAGPGVSGQTNGVFAVAAAPAAPVPTKKPKRWFDVIPMVLQNFKTHDQEQVKQLALPQCVVCKLREKAQKAEVKCRQEDCKLVDQPLCSRCWETSHSSDEKKQHRQLPTAICQQCEVDRITFWCADCDLKFCQVCFDRIHSVTKTKIHRKVASEDAPGSCLVKSDWSEPFQNAIMQMIAARKHPPPALAGSGGNSIDRYHEMNQNVTNMELQSEQLTRQIAVATCQGPYAAGSIMGMLNKLQPVLEAARERRDKFLIAMIIQSNDIMAAVRLLRLTELGDVPQVPMISHRKCLQISNEINQHKKKLIELNQQLSETLNLSNAVSSNWENTLIRTTSGNIQMHEKSIKKLKKDREVEIVRIVQFSNNIRVTLKLAFQRSVEIRRQHQQQQQQQFQPYG